MQRLAAVAVAICVFAASACTASRVAQDTEIRLRGTVQGADGRPLAGAKVVLIKEADLGEAVFGLALVAGTLGTVCLLDEPPAICSGARRAVTADDGAYSFQLRGRDTQGLVGNASTFYLSTGLGAGGPTVSARFQVQRTDLTIPTLRIWAPQVNLTVSRTARAEWQPLDTGASERVVFFDGTDGAIIWSADGRPPLSLDARVLEDSLGTGAVESSTSADRDGTTFRLTHRSPHVPYTANAGAPPSRGAGCTPSPCAATDGDLGPASTSPPAPSPQEVAIDFGRSRSVSFIVVRGCPGECGVETTIDNVDWKLVGSGNKPFFSITPILSQAVISVRVKSTSDLSRLAELSVW